MQETENVAIGDEVVDEYGEKWIVVREPYEIGLPPKTKLVLLWNGNFMTESKLPVVKTGRNYPQITHVLNELGKR